MHALYLYVTIQISAYIPLPGGDLPDFSNPAITLLY